MKRKLFEGKFKVRRVASPNEIFDILDQIPNGRFVTFGYVTSANLKVPTVKRKNPLTNRMNNYDDYSVFGNEHGDIAALVKISAWNFNFLNRESITNKYETWYKPAANSIRADYGLPPIADKKNGAYTTTINYGNGGINVYNGNNKDLQGHAYVPSNVADVKPNSVIYPIGSDGKILNSDGLSKEQILQYLGPKREVNGVSALRKMNAEEEKIKEYISRIKGLKFSYKNFEHNSLLWVATTVNGEALVYINTNLNRIVNEIPISPGDFIKIAEKRYKVELEDVEIKNEELEQKQNMKTESINRKLVRLTESDLHFIVKNAVKRILREAGNDKWDHHDPDKYNKNGWCHLDSPEPEDEIESALGKYWEKIYGKKRNY